MKGWSVSKKTQASPPDCDHSIICFSGAFKYRLVHSASTFQYLLGTHCEAGTMYSSCREACARCTGLRHVLEA